MSEEAEKKPDTITIVLSDQAGEKMHFKVKKETKFQKVFDAYATRLGVPVTSLTFRFDGERITAEHTPKMLEMEDEDMIEVLMQQVGGW
jgi:small ubiquitin-related modifier